ncbi:2741_t:CDS:2, partial [Racocetra fulgida]
LNENLNDHLYNPTNIKQNPKYTIQNHTESLNDHFYNPTNIEQNPKYTIQSQYPINVASPNESLSDHSYYSQNQEVQQRTYKASESNYKSKSNNYKKPNIQPKYNDNNRVHDDFININDYNKFINDHNNFINNCNNFIDDHNLKNTPISIKPQRNSFKSNQTNWTNNKIEALIYSIKQHYNKLKNASNNTIRAKVWDNIFDEFNQLFSDNKNRNINAVKNKWKDLINRYKNIVDNNKRTGAERIVCDFIEDLGEILDKNPSVRPLVTSEKNISDQTASKKRKNEKDDILEYLKRREEKADKFRENFLEIVNNFLN